MYRIITLLLIIGLQACNSQSLNLIDNFYSYENKKTLEGKFPNMYTNMFYGDEVLVAVIPEYRHLGVNGFVELMFCKDRLAAVLFYPQNSDSTKYYNKVTNRLGISKNRDVVKGNIKISLRKAYYKISFSYFSKTALHSFDLRLAKERKEYGLTCKDVR
ncbi:MAG: hypothetical protein HC877_24010 [Thioploca sp.]|nr:hypothetical protein [Thioploca sp.]